MFAGYQGFGNEVLREGGGMNLDIQIPLRDLLSGEQIKLGDESVLEMVNALALDAIIAAREFVDLIDIDVQHLEYAILSPHWPILNRKVGRLHIGTHNQEAHAAIRHDLSENGWIVEIDMLPYSSTECVGGPTKINDGILAAKSPRRR
jgi:hypothetical protein